MNSPPNVTSSREQPAAVLRAAQRGPSDETDSGVFELFESAILVLVSSPELFGPAVSELEAAGFSVLFVTEPKRVEEWAFLPRFALVETALPGALDLLHRLNAPEPVMQVLAMLGPSEAEGPALVAGAVQTLRGPLDTASLLLCLQRLRAQSERRRRPAQIFEPARERVPATILESVLATIGHEIQNPLAAALASVECLREPEFGRRLDEAERIAAADDATIALRRIRDVLGAVSFLVRGTTPELSRLSLWECAERAVGALGSPQVRIELAGDEHVRALANGVLLERVILNLLQNAIDATEGSPNPRILVRVYQAEQEARVSIRDNGPGVPREHRQRIFEPFFTTKGERGTGLGLVLVHHAVARMSGAVTLGRSQSGAVFRVRLRAA